MRPLCPRNDSVTQAYLAELGGVPLFLIVDDEAVAESAVTRYSEARTL